MEVKVADQYAIHVKKKWKVQKMYEHLKSCTSLTHFKTVESVEDLLRDSYIIL